MALVQCFECGVEVSDRAPACPRCGHPQQSARTPPVEAAYTPVVPPPRIRYVNIMLSAVFLIWGIYLLRVGIPAHDPKNVKLLDTIAAELRGEKPWVFRDGLYPIVWYGTLTLVVLCGVSLMTGSVQIVGKLAYCRTCALQVVALRTWPFGWKCERCDIDISNSGGPRGGTVPAILSLIIPGAGQLKLGRTGKAVGHLAAALCLWLVFLGWIVHVYSAWEASR